MTLPTSFHENIINKIVHARRGHPAAQVSYTVDSCIRGYHVYKDIWTAPLGEILTCQNEFENPTDPYAVAMMTASNITVDQAT